ncbi:uncharacterized protein N7469_009433 [Penicillium citrinum]|uniref:mRNA stability protein n=2 Tax=Penicillium TaxID=5073 RepID=A0A9W9NQT8_PENCI|nr:uncharacterized protein N7469_009433 [Penicillium citrinum]KAJ5223193.1 hypothetical protein N7469_009433 [Penicillium citrinum]KAJ5581362.1 hypothetical protein N7450_007663 [Penicillium hetheringtonii]
MKSERKTSNPEPLSESEKCHFSLYEKKPLGYLLDKRFKERTYFDSGDFALSAGQRAIETGAIDSGCEHPNRDNISHPNAPVPSNSNVDYGANRTTDRKSISPERKSLLHYETDTTDSK